MTDEPHTLDITAHGGVPREQSWAAPLNPNSPTMQAVRAELEARAKATAEAIIEARARDFAMQPAMLDLLEPDRALLGLTPLSKLPPLRLRSRIEELTAAEIAMPRRFRGFGGEVPLINLKAALRYAQRLVDIEDVARGLRHATTEGRAP
ncbi:MAG: hypothetical protein ACREC9_12380 [Methylocella sp.]